MQRIIQFFSQRATTLFFPMALILYDFVRLSDDGSDSA
ncbi:multidrug efflux system protein MdtM, partial [Salmonella enterica subsp. enterica serovar Anatum str. USDA 100]